MPKIHLCNRPLEIRAADHAPARGNRRLGVDEDNRVPYQSSYAELNQSASKQYVPGIRDRRESSNAGNLEIYERQSVRAA